MCAKEKKLQLKKQQRKMCHLNLIEKEVKGYLLDITIRCSRSQEYDNAEVHKSQGANTEE